jgi:hypothetical protein
MYSDNQIHPNSNLPIMYHPLVKQTFSISRHGQEGLGRTHATRYPTRGKSSTASKPLLYPLDYRTVRLAPVGIPALITSTS